MQDWGESIDALCGRQVAFALYQLPDAASYSFCMAADGAARAQGAGFLVADFEGRVSLIPAELTCPPDAARVNVFPERPAPDALPAATTRGEYAALFRRVKTELASGRLRKLVLARTADVATGEKKLSPWAAFCAAAAASPNLFTALVHTPQHGTWLCCTPELLLRGSGEDWETMALAGTRPCSEDAWDAKNTREQAVVADYVQGVLKKHAAAVSVSPVCNRNSGAIEHLCTHFRFRMAAAGLGNLLAELPPTPAVSGFPVAAAREYLNSQPDIARGLYAGYMGERGGDSAQLYVSLRCMQLLPDRCRLYAGGGIMPDSEEEAEWQETEAKCGTMRRVIETCISEPS